MKNRLTIIGLFCTFFFAISCSKKESVINEATSEIEVVDTKGNTVELSKPAERVVCLFDPAVDMFQMLGAADKLVGIPIETYIDNELYKPLSLIDERIATKSLPAPGSNELQQIEEIISLKPDLLIVQGLNDGMVKTLNNMGIAVYMMTSESRENLFQELNDISILIGKQERGKELAAFAKEKFELLEAEANVIPKQNKKIVYFTWANGRVFSTAGRSSMMNDCLVYAGTVNACTSFIDQPNINPETLVTWNPDMIVMWNDSPELFYDKKELATVKAIKNKAIYNLMPMFFYNPHTLKSLCASIAIKEWAYGNPEIAKKEVKAIMIELYGKEKAEKLFTLL